MTWMEPVARAAEQRLTAAGIRLTLGGEPTFVPFRPEGAEWSITADGPTKLGYARALARELQQTIWPESTLLYCPGKRYEGEVNPRWALRLINAPEGSTPPVRWPSPAQPGLEGLPLAPEAGAAWLSRLGARLGVRLQPLPLRDPHDPQRRVWAAPLDVDTPDPQASPDAPPVWLAAAWPLAEELRLLEPAAGPAGLRLPLQHLPPDLAARVLTLEVDREGWELFLPPLLRRPLELLLQAVADSLDGTAAPRLSGMLPADADDHWQVLGLTADPGVLEVNLPVCHRWSDYHGWLQRLEQGGERVGLRSWKPGPDGEPVGTGGGNHLLWGGPSLEQHPFFPRPAWLAGLLRYWQHHPSLSYLFSGDGVGPASQAPRPDEAAGDILELELAYRALEQAEAHAAAGDDHRWLIGETLRHLHADRSGNNHRSEISFDKFWNPGTPAGCLGLVEFRALESLPQVAWSTAVALLWSALAAHLLDPRHRPAGLRDWGAALHDRMLLPSQLWADLEAILAELAADGLPLDPEPFRQIWDWRFPPLLRWSAGEARLEIRSAPEPWPLICDFPREGGFTSRFIDGSLRRFEISASPSFRQHWQLHLAGRPLPLAAAEAGGAAPPPLAVRYRLQRLYPCLHPAIEPHTGLPLVISGPDTVVGFRLSEDGRRFQEDPAATATVQAGARPWRGYRRPGDLTLDLRLEAPLTS